MNGDARVGCWGECSFHRARVPTVAFAPSICDITTPHHLSNRRSRSLGSTGASCAGGCALVTDPRRDGTEITQRAFSGAADDTFCVVGEGLGFRFVGHRVRSL